MFPWDAWPGCRAAVTAPCSELSYSSAQGRVAYLWKKVGLSMLAFIPNETYSESNHNSKSKDGLWQLYAHLVLKQLSQSFWRLLYIPAAAPLAVSRRKHCQTAAALRLVKHLAAWFFCTCISVTEYMACFLSLTKGKNTIFETCASSLPFSRSTTQMQTCHRFKLLLNLLRI